MTFWKKKDEEGSQAINDSQSGAIKSVPVDSTVEATPLVLSKLAYEEALPSAPKSFQSQTQTMAEKDISSDPQDNLNQKYGRVRSALGSGTIIQGKLSFDTPVRIDGKLSGEVFSSKALIVGPSGVIDATIDAACLVILGQVRGKVKASEKIELYAGAQLEGSIQTPVLVIASGAKFNGDCLMNSQATAAAVGSRDALRAGEQQTTGKTAIVTDQDVDLANVLAQKIPSGTEDTSKKAKDTEDSKSETVANTQASLQ